jgi:hypothetical protein
MKRAMGSPTFATQYQQSPVPPGGNMIDWNWFNWYDPDQISKVKFDKIVISWDTATKATELRLLGRDCLGGWFYYLLNVIRERLEFPALERKVIQVSNWWH